MIEARTMSTYPALRATSAMMSSGALPNVAFSSPPTASPVRVAICSVARTIIAAIGTMASAAEKKTTGAGEAPMCSTASVIGMNASSQLIEGFMTERLLSICPLGGSSGDRRDFVARHACAPSSGQPSATQAFVRV